ncbi:hypothetical protein CCP4SC76_8000006 [Gammaproteobacteria bacterium]
MPVSPAISQGGGGYVPPSPVHPCLTMGGNHSFDSNTNKIIRITGANNSGWAITLDHGELSGPWSCTNYSVPSSLAGGLSAWGDIVFNNPTPGTGTQYEGALTVWAKDSAGVLYCCGSVNLRGAY